MAEVLPDRPAPLAGGNSCCWECGTMPCGCIATNDSVEVRLCACIFFAFEVVPFDSNGPCIARFTLLIGTCPPLQRKMSFSGLVKEIVMERSYIPCRPAIWKEPSEGARIIEPVMLGLLPVSDKSGAPLPFVASNIAFGLDRPWSSESTRV